MINKIINHFTSSDPIAKNNRIFPRSIGKYEFIKEVSFAKSLSQYTFALYKGKQGETVLAKAWFGSKSNQHYLWLKQAGEIHQLLGKKHQQNQDQKLIKIPKLLAAYESELALIILTEYAAHSKDEFNQKELIRNYNSAISFIQNQKGALTTKARIEKLGPIKILISLPVLCFLALITKPHLFKQLARAMWFVTCNLNSLFKATWTTLVHRDLRGSILKTKTELVIIDWQLAMLSQKYLELAQLMMIYWQNNKFEINLEQLELFKEAHQDKTSLHILKILCIYVVLVESIFVKTKSITDEKSFLEYVLNLKISSIPTRIVISSYDDIKNPHYAGGGAIAIHNLARELNKKYQITILSWNHSGIKDEIIDGIHYQRYGVSSLPPKLAMLVFQLTLPVKCAQLKSDVWFESFTPPFTTSFLPLFTRKKVVGIVHMLAAEDMTRKYKLPFHLIENAGLKLYKNIIVTSESFKKTIEKVNTQAVITVISNGVSRIAKTKNTRKDYVLYLGRVEINQKGIDLLLLAFKKLLRQYPAPLKLIIAGQADIHQLKELERLIETHSLREHVEVKGSVQGQKKSKLISEAKCVVIPSRFETFSLVALEAMAHSTPVVCFDIAGLKWAPTTAAKRVAKFSYHKLANEIQFILKDAALLKSMGTAGKEYAKNFTWTSIAKSYDSYLRNSI